MTSTIKNIDYDSMEFRSIEEDLEYDDEEYEEVTKKKETDTDLVA